MMPTYDSAREAIAEFLNGLQSLRDLGLPENSVLQADTLDSPTEFPFVVIRWMPDAGGVGPGSRRPFDLWVYDDPGDYRRAEQIGNMALQELGNVVALKTTTGCISQIEVKSTIGGGTLGRGADLWDDGYKAVVIPFRARAIATGA